MSNTDNTTDGQEDEPFLEDLGDSADEEEVVDEPAKSSDIDEENDPERLREARQKIEKLAERKRLREELGSVFEDEKVDDEED